MTLLLAQGDAERMLVCICGTLDGDSAPAAAAAARVAAVAASDTAAPANC